MMPHPPVIIPAVGKGRETAASRTISSCLMVAERIASLKPETIVFISPHAPLFSDYLYIYDEPVLSGSFARFGAHTVSFSCPQDTEFVRAFKELLADADIPGGTPGPEVLSRFDGGNELDHGVLVPLHFIHAAYSGFRIVCLSSSAFETDMVLETGRLLRQAAEKTGRRTCVVASGDLSHRVTTESPYGMVREGAMFDKALSDAIERGSLADILSIDPLLREQAAECGYNSFVMLIGALGLREKAVSSLKTTLYSEEAPFGIGYCVAGFEPDDGDKTDVRATDERAIREEGPSWPVVLAITTIERYVKTGEILRYDGATLHGIKRAGCFVSLKKSGDLRGCIGTISPVTECIEEEIIRNAVAACSSDYRFDPVEADELTDLVVSVDILSESEPVASRDDLDPSKYGVIVTSGFKRGLLLPDLEGVDTVETQLAIACRKGGIDPDGEYEMQRFTVTRYH